MWQKGNSMRALIRMCLIAAVIVVSGRFTSAAAQCVGDANGDGTVRVNELVTVVSPVSYAR